MIFQLFKIFASNIFSFNGIIDRSNGVADKKGKNTAKIVLFVCLFVFIITYFVFALGNIMNTLYAQLAVIGKQELLPVISLILSVFIAVFFGFTSVSSNYYGGIGEDQLRSMPVTDIQFFAAKFGVSTLTDSFFSLLIFAGSAGIYAYHEQLLKNPLFYFGTLLIILTFSLVAVAFIYFLFILLLNIFPVLRKKSLLTGVASIFGFAFVIIFSLGNSTISTKFSSQDAADLSAITNQLISMEDSFQTKLSFLMFVSKAIKGNLFSILVLLVICAFVIFVFLPVFGKLYIKSLEGFADVKTKKLSVQKVNQVIRKDIHSDSIFQTLLMRDIKNMFREPSFFANGPLLVFLLPLIILVSIGIGFLSAAENTFSDIKFDILELFNNVNPEKLTEIYYLITLICSLVIIFIGNSSSVAVSSFSREGKALNYLKAMPIRNNTIVKVKFIHACLYVLIPYVEVVLLLSIIKIVIGVPIPTISFVKILFFTALLSFTVSLVLVFIDMYIDTVRPKLQWENPIAAFKQNINSVFAVFIDMGIVAVTAGFGVTLPKSELSLLIISVFFGIIAAIISSRYFKYAEKRLSTM